jgi:hypothetical protein
MGDISGAIICTIAFQRAFLAWSGKSHEKHTASSKRRTFFRHQIKKKISGTITVEIDR